jgi:hypothetical protein
MSSYLWSTERGGDPMKIRKSGRQIVSSLDISKGM